MMEHIFLETGLPVWAFLITAFLFAFKELNK